MNTRNEVIKDAIDASIKGMDPAWLLNYDVLSKLLLTRMRYVCGDDFKFFAKLRGLPEPRDDHHWVGYPERLRRMNWIKPLIFVRPTRFHNHMKEVTYYLSLKFDDASLKVPD